MNAKNNLASIFPAKRPKESIMNGQVNVGDDGYKQVRLYVL
jgi:hypothetical protein